MTLPRSWGRVVEGSSSLATAPPLPHPGWSELGRRPGEVVSRLGKRVTVFQWGVSYCPVVLYLKWKRGCKCGKSRVVDVKNLG